MNGILIKIEKKNFNNNSYSYAYKIAKAYMAREEEVINHVVLSRTTEFYKNRNTTDEIKEKLGSPYIEILNDKFGVIVWLNHQLDEHIIECEFVDDMQLLDVIIDG